MQSLMLYKSLKIVKNTFPYLCAEKAFKVDIDLFPWPHYHLVTEGEKTASLKAYSQAFTNTKSSFSFGCFAESCREKTWDGCVLATGDMMQVVCS